MNLNELALKVHPKILQQDTIFKEHSDVSITYLQGLSDKEKEQCQKKMLAGRVKGYIKEKVNLTKKDIPSHMITLEILKENLSIESIAKKRSVSVETIINHIEKLQSLKKIDDAQMACLKKGISETDFDIIFSALSQSEDGRLKPIYEQFDGKYSYANIRIVRLFVNK